MYKEYPTFQPDEILVYLRKSRSDDPSLTIEEVLEKHEGVLKEWEERNLSEPIPQENWYREVVSGESISARPQFKTILKRMESQKIKGVLVVECARLGRPDLEEIGKLSKLFRYTNTLVITPHKIFDLSDEYDREQFERELMRGNDYLEYTKKILQRGRDISLRQGNFISSVVPYGYKRAWIIENKKKCPTLEIDEEEAKLVKMIFDWYVYEGIGATKICQRLNELGIKSSRGTLWKKSTIVKMLRNEHYIGKIVIKRHIKVNTVKDQEIIKQCVFNEDYEIVDGKHPAIIDEETFYKATHRISKHISVKPNETLQNPFASILKCECGRTILRRRNKNTYRYLCDEQMFCGNASIGEKELIDAVIEHLKKSIEDLSAKVTNEDDKYKKEKHTEYVSLLESRIIEVEKKELSLWDKYAEENMPKPIFDKLMADCKEKKKNIEKELEAAYNNAPVHIDYKSAISTLHEAINALPDDSVSASAKNKLLLSVVDKIEYRRPKAIRMTVEEAKEKGVTLAGGWYCPEFSLDIQLKF